MLKQRLITAFVLIVGFLGTLFFASPRVFCIFTAIIGLLAAFEWTALMGLKKTAYRLSYVAFVGLIMGSIFFTSLSFTECLYFFAITFVFWLLTLPLIALYPQALFWKKSLLCQACMGLFVFIPSWLAINFIHAVYDGGGQYLLLYLFVLVWSADAAAYFIGRKWGKKKLVAHVSPGKTRAGVYGGMAAALLVSLIALYLSAIPMSVWPYALCLCLITVVFSIIGDLFESMLKRSEGLKDSGKILPGHGGLLDRIDSLTAAAPVFTLGLLLWVRMNS